MRIIAGDFRGRRLDAPSGRGTRPTTDRVRESLMSAIASLRGGFEDAHVLDAFAGSGALGLEALSRGAASAVFCERDRDALVVLDKNISTLGLERSRARVVRGDVLKRGVVASGHQFDLVFLDPPYATAPQEILTLLQRLNSSNALSLSAIISYEHDKADDEGLAAQYESAELRLASRRHFGATTLDLLERLCAE